MIRWNNDYNRVAHPLVLEALMNNAAESNGGYGIDAWCEKGAAEIKKHLGDVDADIHFLVGGTQTNYTVLASALRPLQSVISADTGHVCAHETGAIENTGHKIHALPNTDGKITAEQIAADAEYYLGSDCKEHITQPKMVYISSPTEFGTITMGIFTNFTEFKCSKNEAVLNLKYSIDVNSEFVSTNSIKIHAIKKNN